MSGRLIGDAYISILADASMFRPDADAKIRAALQGMKFSVPITGDTKDIDAKIAALAAALKGLGKKDAEIGLNIKGAIKDIAGLTTALEALRSRAENIPVDLSDSKMLAKLYGALGVVNDLGAKLENLEADADMSRLLAKFYTAEQVVKDLEASMSHFTPDVDPARFLAKLSVLRDDADQLRSKLSNLRADTRDAGMLAKIATLQDRVLTLAKSMREMPMSANTLPLEASLFKARAEIEALEKAASKVRLAGQVILPVKPGAYSTFGTSAFNPAEARMMDQLTTHTLNAMTAFQSLNRAERDNVGIAPVVVAGIAKLAAAQSMLVTGGAFGGGAWGAWWGALATRVRLFGGALDGVMPKILTHVSVLHVLADVILEIAAAWIPAIIAVGTFAAVAFPTAQKIYGQWKNINTVIDSTGGKLKDLGGNFDVLVKAVQPSVLTLFGEYMLTITRNSGPLATALQGVGRVATEWGAQLVGWADKAAKGFASIVSMGGRDFQQIGQGFYELFRILSSLIKDLPGYVHALLTLGDAVLTIAADTVQALGPLIKFGLAVHGAFLYIGLAVTGVLALGRAMAGGAIATYMAKTGRATSEAGKAAEETGGKFNRFGTAVGNFGGLVAAGAVNVFRYAGSVRAFGRENNIAAVAVKVLKDGMGLIPFGPVGLAAAGAAALVTVLYFAFRNSTTAATQLTRAMASLVTGSSFLTLQRNTSIALETTNRALQAQNVQLKTLELNNAHQASNNQIATAQQAQQQYAASISGTIQAAQNYSMRMAELAKVFGSAGAAQTALTLSGIKAGAVATENNRTWALQLIQLQALSQSMGYMGQSGSAAANQLAALNIAAGNTTKNLQSLKQAEQGWITLITGGDSAFATFEQGQQTLADTLNKNSKGAVTFTVSLGLLRERYKAVGAVMNGTSQASLAARQAFDAQLSAGVTLFGNLQSLSAASGNTAASTHRLAIAGKDIVAQLLPMAAGSKQATAEVYALAQLAGYSGPDSFKRLAQWVGNTKNAEASLNSQQAALTISSAKLTAAAKNLGNALATDVTAAQAAAIVKTSNLTSATQNLATAASKTRGHVSQLAITAAGEYVTSLTRAGVGTKQAKDYLNAYLHQLGYSDQAIKAIDATLTGSTRGWGYYNTAVVHNAEAAKNAAKAATQNRIALEALTAKLPGIASNFHAVWASIVKEDAAMTANGVNAQAVKSSFIDFATHGLHLTTAKADELWKKFGNQNLDTIGSKAGATRDAFIKFAEHGLHLTQSKAQALWNEFALQNLDVLAAKGTNAKNQFIQLAENGLHLTQSKANDLWLTMRNQYLDTLAVKAGETKRAFEKTAHQLGLTRGEADKLWASMHKVAAGSPYSAKIVDTLTGKGGVSAKIGGIAGQAAQAIKMTLSSFAGGGIVPPGSGPAGQDSKVILAAPGELIIPTAHAPKFGALAKSAGIPGFAGGGVVGGRPGGGGLSGGGGTAQGRQIITDEAQLIAFAGKFGTEISTAFGNTVQGVFQAMKNAAMAASFGSSGKGLVAAEEAFNGHRYIWGGGANPISGWDCSSFQSYILGTHGFPLPGGFHAPSNAHGPTTGSYLSGYGKHIPYNAMVPGDLYVNSHHMGMVTGMGKGFAARSTATGTGPQVVPPGRYTIVEPPGLNAFNLGSMFGGPVPGGFGNLMIIARYLMANGMNASAAAGITGTIAGESVPPGNPESRNCVPLTYKVVTTRGILRHDEVRIGDRTPVYSVRTGTVREAVIVDVPYHYNARICRIGNEGWSVICTHDHKWITDQGLVRADAMRPGMKILLGDGWLEPFEFFEDRGRDDTFCLTTTTGTWTTYRDEDVAAEEGVAAGAFWTGNSGGWGLIGWTGNTIGLPAGYTGPTGNVQFDMANQLRGIIGYMNARGGPGPLNSAGSPIAAGNVWSRYEAPAVPLSDTRPQIAMQIYSQLAGGGGPVAVPGGGGKGPGGGHHLSSGGFVNEPVYGFGQYSGLPYSFAESGPEQVIPGGKATQPAPMVQPMTTHQGGHILCALQAMVKLLQQMPYAYAKALSQGGGNGVRHGYYTAQN